MEDKSRLEQDMVPIATENEELQCGKCRYVIPGNTMACEKYLEKPGFVLYRTKKCPDFAGRHWWNRK